ncbi:putative ATP-dependent RNA helicase YTHDC2 [Dufourea novaeangliae]|uniref:Putative ATP-dependent RNA helicase YTHDC2 n=1 Tax=Dufourea novaeangliae TaxID=178035 RepID=A0A154PQ09_DUFNO|nr:putative ATP-dependent RNA helicase YTHDC2 [Dufourea novaeangliae]
MPRQSRCKKSPLVGEDTRIAVNLTLKKLLESTDQKELEFPSSYTADDRAYIHEIAGVLGLKSKSRGKGRNRYLTVYKREGSTIVQADAVLKLQKASRQSIYTLLQNFPLNHKECHDLLPPIERERPLNTDVSVHTNTKAMGRLNNSVPQVPQLKTNFDVLYFRKSLPVFNVREDILNALNTNEVVIIGGETGCGKTTQVPQFILEHCQQRHQPCRIICTQPRRLSAVSVAERVAFERDEKIGQTFGYQIRLESRVAPKTLLTYCTNGVLLRTLMAGDSALNTVTHIIVDEVHERDKFCDFLLIALKDALLKHRSLKLILMSATLDVDIFVKYFNKCAVINVVGRSFDVDTYFLEDVLKLTGYMTKEMVAKKKELMKKKDQHKLLESWTQYKPEQTVPDTVKKWLKNDRSLPAPILAQQNTYHHTFNDDNINYDLLLQLILYIHLKMPPGSLLVFLPGYDDIVTMREKINNEEKEMNQGLRYTLYVLHSNMQTCDQKKVFKPSPQGTRKIILSTNLAETSITIDDVVYVIDSGKVKENSFDALLGVCMLKCNWISQACAKQRKGRAGRCRKGICYRLFSSIRYNIMQPYQTSEILRLPLQELCLYTKHLAPGNTPIAEYLDRALEPPSNVVTRNAVQLLKTIDALDPWEDLTELGSHLLDLPIEPRLGKMLLYAVVLKCLDPVLTIVCSLSYRDPFILPLQPSQKRAATAARKRFATNTYSDHMAVLRAFQGWQNARASGKERTFCEQNFISAAVMEMVVGMRTQLLGQLRASGFVRARGPGDIRDLNSNSENWAVVKAAITAGLYPNLMRVDREHMQLRTQKEVKVCFHPSSTLRDYPKSPRTTSAQTHAANVETLPSDWLLYEEISRTGRFCHVKMVTLVNSLTVALFCGPARLSVDVIYETESVPESESDSEVDESNEGTIFKLDDWVVFKLDTETARIFLHLRQKWNALFLRRMKTPNKAMSQLDEKVVSTLVSVLTNEEQACGLQQPSGIGQRPRPLIVDYYPANARRTDDFVERNI